MVYVTTKDKWLLTSKIYSMFVLYNNPVKVETLADIYSTCQRRSLRRRLG